MKKSLAFALVSAVLTAPVLAADSGAYIGVNYGRATASGNLVVGLNTTHSDSSLGLTGGYQFNKNFAAELQFIDFGSLAQGSSRTTTDGFALSAVGILPVSEKFSAFAKLGFAQTAVKVSAPAVNTVDNKSDITYGLGAQYNFTDAIGARIGYDSYKVGQKQPYGTDGTYTVVSASVMYKF